MTIVFIAFLLPALQTASAQDFLTGAHLFSSKKESYFTLKDGQKMTAKVAKIKRKKGLITSIRIEMADGSKRTLNPSEIDHMYLAPSGFDNFTKSTEKAGNISKWSANTDINKGCTEEGYVLFESSKFIIKKKEREVLGQLLNPGYTTCAKIYFDPFAKETTRVVAGPLTLAGGDVKSYYIKVGINPAYLLKKSDYKKAQSTLFKNCKTLGPAFKNNLTWKDFAKHLYFYSTECHEGQGDPIIIIV